MEWLILLLLLGFIPANIAARKGYSAFGWYLYGVVLFPVALIHALLTDDAGRNRICPFCAERIMAAAKVCPHCQREVAGTAIAPPSPRSALSVALEKAADGSKKESRIPLAAGLTVIAVLVAISVWFEYSKFRSPPAVVAAPRDWRKELPNPLPQTSQEVRDFCLRFDGEELTYCLNGVSDLAGLPRP